MPPSASFYTVSSGTQQIGFASTTLDTVPLGFRVADRLRLDFRDTQKPYSLIVSQDALLTHSFGLESFEAAVAYRGVREIVTGQMDGDSAMVISWRNSDSFSRRERTPGVGALFLTTLPLQVAFGSIPPRAREGEQPVFDPLTAGWDDTPVTSLGDSLFIVPDSAVYDSATARWVAAHLDTLRARQVQWSIRGIPARAWIDAEGRVVEWSSPLGLTFRRSAFEIALIDYRNRLSTAQQPDSNFWIIPRTALAGGGRSPAPPLVSLDVVLGTTEGRQVDLRGVNLADARQRLRGDTLSILADTTALDSTGGSSYLLPYRGDSLAHLLESDPLATADDPEIRGAAQRLLAGVRNSHEAAVRLTKWVHRQVKPTASEETANATRTLRLRSGDAHEQALLLTALARAGGLPARTVAGVLYRADRFYYHTWTEIFVGEWIAADAVTGQLPADAAHIRFTTGGLGRPVDLLPLLGGLRLQVLAPQEIS